MAEKRHCPLLATDAICIRHNPETGKKQILLITRKKNPSIGCFAFPGGHVDYGEDPEVCVLRELQEETTITGRSPRLHGVRGKPERDQRQHVVSIIYWVTIEDSAIPIADDDAASAAFYDLDYVEGLQPGAFAFDHHEIIQEVLKEVHSKK